MFVNARFVSVIIMICCAITCIAQQTYVLAVGISDYKEINDLNLCENDAHDFAALMNEFSSNVSILTGSHATHENIILSLRGMLAKAKPEDNVVFFFSGHGYEGGFCCWDMSTKTPSPNTTLGKDLTDKQRLNSTNRYYGGLSYAELQVLFRNCRAGRKFVFADACFSGGLRKGNHLNTSVQSAKKGDLIFFLSSQPDETSLEMSGSDNGLFTTYLLSGLSGNADINSDNIISIGELYGYVYRNVAEYTSKIPHSQHPVLWGQYKDEMPILRIK